MPATRHGATRKPTNKISHRSRNRNYASAGTYRASARGTSILSLPLIPHWPPVKGLCGNTAPAACQLAPTHSRLSSRGSLAP